MSKLLNSQTMWGQTVILSTARLATRQLFRSSGQ